MPRQLSTARRSHPTNGRWSYIFNSVLFLNYHLLRMLDLHQCLYSLDVLAIQMTHLYHSYIPLNSSITANWNTCVSHVRLRYPLNIHANSCGAQVPFRHILVLLANLSAFAEHQTRQFPVVGGPRAFAQPNNFYHLLLSNRFYQCETFQPSLSLQAGSSTV